MYGRIAYRNGYVLKNSDGELDIAGELTNAGNGNGFKMGGDGLPGGSIYDPDYDKENNVFSGHKLKNSVAFENKSKGFDSNSCSNNKVSNSISFNNESSNVALYSYSTTKTTGYETQNVISFGTKDTGVADEISAKNQNKQDYENSTTYLWDGAKQQAVNSDGKAVDAGWFESLEFKAGKTPYSDKDVNGVLLGRNSNGTIDMGGFLVLKPDAGVGNTGLGAGQGSTGNDALTEGSIDTDGSISSGDVTITDSTTSSEIAKEENDVSSELSKDKNYGIYVKYLEEVSYTGTAVKPEFRVYLNGVAFTDYKVTYKNNVNAYVEGNKRYENIPDAKRPTLVLTLKGSYQGTYEYYFDIKPVDINTVSVSGLSGLADGRAKKIAPTLIYNGKKLTADKDYTVTSADSQYTEAGEYPVKIDATECKSGNFTGTIEKKFILLSEGEDINKINPCSFTSGNITAKSVTDVFTNGKQTIKPSELEKSKVVVTNVNKVLAKKRDYTLLYEYDLTVPSEDGKTVTTQTVTYEPQNPSDKEKGSTPIEIPKETGLNVRVYAKPVDGGNFSPIKDAKGLQIAEFRVAYYNIAQAKLQVVDKAIYESEKKVKTTPLYFVDDTETQKANLGALNRLNNYTTNANKDAPYYIMLTHPAMENETKQLSFGSYENRDSLDQKDQYTYDYENTATTVAGKHSVTLYGTGMFGGTRVFKYNLVKKTYDLKKLIVDMKTVEAPALNPSATKDVNDAAIKAKLEGKIIINGNILKTEYIKLNYDASTIQSGKALKVTITGDEVNGIKVYSGFKTISIKVQ